MLPLMKVLLVGFKIISRPLNNILKKVFIHRFQFMHRFIGYCGQKAHVWEIQLNRKIVNNNQKLDFYIKPLSEEAAFNKGVEYFVEVFFFYGVLISIAIWEIKKSHDSSERQKAQLKDLKTFCTENQELCAKLQEELQHYRIQKIQSDEEMKNIQQEFRLLNERFSSTFHDKEI
eukprot:403375454